MISPQEVDLGHLAVRELEDELVDVEAEHRVEDRPIRAPGERPAEVVPEAEVGAEPDATHGPARSAALNSAAKSDGASGWIAGDGSSIWMIVGARVDEAARSSARRIGTNASAAATRVA